MQPLVSILINNYNYGRFLGDAIDSALAQSWPRVEVVVVDDGSTDNSREVIARYGNRVRAVLKPNGGQASAYNAGFAATRGEIVCLLDADDLFLPEKVARVVQILNGKPHLGWIFDVVQKFDHASGKRLHKDLPSRCGEWDMRKLTLAGSPPFLHTSSSGLSFRQALLGRILPMPERMTIATGSCSDVYIKWISLAYEPGWMCDEELTLVRVHGENAYTARTAGKNRLRGQIDLSTGMCLCQHWPALRKLGAKVFSRGWATLRADGGLPPESQSQVTAFLRSMPLPLRAEVLARTLAWQGIDWWRR